MPSTPTVSSAGADPSSAAPVSSSAVAGVAAAAVGAGPSSAAPASSAAAAAAGVSAGSVFVKRAEDVDAAFAEVDIYAGDSVARLADRACAKFRWLVGADKVKLFLVPVESEDSVAAGEDGSEALVLATRPLSSIKALSAVSIRDRSCLLARLADPPAAAPGECARAARSLLPCSQSREGRRGSREVREIRLGLRVALTLFCLCFPSFNPSGGGSGSNAAAAAGGGGGGDAGPAELGEILGRLVLALGQQGAMLVQQGAVLASLVKQNKMEDFNFSKVSGPCVSRAAEALEVEVKGRLLLPDLSPYMPAAAGVSAYAWGANEKETAASPHLLALLSAWVKVGAVPPIANTFFDVQPLASHTPMALVVEDVGTFRGMPDAIAPCSAVGIAEELQPVSSSAVVSVDWKTPSAFASVGAVTSIGHIQAMAFASKRKSVPVFFTDMVSGFRCWIVIANRLYYLHPGDSLSLREGVALMRYFLSRSEMDGSTAKVVDGALHVDNLPIALSLPPPSSFGSIAAGGGSGSGGSDCGGAGSGSLGGGGNKGKSKGSGRGGGGHVRTSATLLSPGDSGCDDSDADISPETIRDIAVALSEGGGMRLEY